MQESEIEYVWPVKRTFAYIKFINRSIHSTMLDTALSKRKKRLSPGGETKEKETLSKSRRRKEREGGIEKVEDEIRGYFLCLSTVDTCGQARTPATRVVGGTSTECRSKYPWVVILLHNSQSSCGGVIWDTYHVLTAAHCLDG